MAVTVVVTAAVVAVVVVAEAGTAAEDSWSGGGGRWRRWWRRLVSMRSFRSSGGGGGGNSMKSWSGGSQSSSSMRSFRSSGGDGGKSSWSAAAPRRLWSGGNGGNNQPTFSGSVDALALRFVRAMAISEIRRDSSAISPAAILSGNNSSGQSGDAMRQYRAFRAQSGDGSNRNFSASGSPGKNSGNDQLQNMFKQYQRPTNGPTTTRARSFDRSRGRNWPATTTAAIRPRSSNSPVGTTTAIAVVAIGIQSGKDGSVKDGPFKDNCRQASRRQ